MGTFNTLSKKYSTHSLPGFFKGIYKKDCWDSSFLGRHLIDGSNSIKNLLERCNCFIWFGSGDIDINPF